MNGKILLIVDPQYDFINGSLEVNGAEEAMDKLADFIKQNGSDYDNIIITADWHPQSHCSFKQNGGIWPIHCVQHSHGAAIYQPIFNALNEIKSNYIVLTKGVDEDHEEYSIFKNQKSCASISIICDTLKINSIDVCGLAFDYCVADSVKDGLRELPNVSFKVFKELSPEIGKETADEFIKFINNSERVDLV